MLRGGEGQLSDSWVSWCELCCAPAVPFGQHHPLLPPPLTILTPLTTKQALQVLPAKISLDLVTSMLIIFSYAVAAHIDRT